MNNRETEILQIVKELSLGRPLNFARLLELHGIADADQPAYIKRAESLSHVMMQVCKAYVQQSDVGDKNVFVALTAGMVMDGGLRALVGVEKSESIIAADQQSTISASTTEH